MLEKVTNSRTFLSFILAGVTGLILFFAYPFPQGNLYLQYIALKDPLVSAVLARSYTLFLFTTPFFIYSAALSGSVCAELWPETQTEDKSTPALSRSEFQGGFISDCRRSSSSNENRARQQSALAGDSRKGIVHRHRDLWRNRNRKDKLLYAAICRAIDRI
jgi:hypothetical protein